MPRQCDPDGPGSSRDCSSHRHARGRWPTATKKSLPARPQLVTDVCQLEDGRDVSPLGRSAQMGFCSAPLAAVVHLQTGDKIRVLRVFDKVRSTNGRSHVAKFQRPWGSFGGNPLPTSWSAVTQHQLVSWSSRTASAGGPTATSPTAIGFLSNHPADLPDSIART